MGILILNKTSCPICNCNIMDYDDFFTFPSFVINKKDPLYFYSDMSFHSKCLEKEPLGLISKKFAKMFERAIRPEFRVCIIGGGYINNQNDHIFIDYLTSNENDFLYQFNFAHIDKNNLHKWEKKNELIFQLNTFLESKLWDDNNFGYLSKLIKSLL